MPDNALTIPFARSLNRAMERKILDALQQQGKALPCSVVSVSGSIVTVKFEVNSDYTLPQVTMPVFGPEYIRYPIKVGDKGVTISADAYLGGMSGLGGGVASLTQPANLSALFFMPISNKNWSATDDPNAVVIYGPDGVILRDSNSQNKLAVTPTGVTQTNGGGATPNKTTRILANGHWQLLANDGSTVLIDVSETAAIKLGGAASTAITRVLTGSLTTVGQSIAQNGGAVNFTSTVTGAKTGDVVIATANAGVDGFLTVQWYIPSNNTVGVTFENVFASSSRTLATITYSLLVIGWT